ncbi:hypothetical protein GGX14DRAFT_407552 [Mycena pura]|uniref:Uncharacterized protein n=1 Tax=Mycena pura TaxID=153505 RepID=A0AAD6XYP0_9AGAR|nr:hypothetical protein GGX14DRAFT_407552 [Mycena pura]
MITVYGDVVRLSDSPTFDFSVDAFETMVYHNLAICTARQVAYARLRSANDGWADWEDSDFEDIPELVDPFEAAGDQGTTAILGRVGEHCHAPAGGGAQRAGVREPETSQKPCRDVRGDGAGAAVVCGEGAPKWWAEARQARVAEEAPGYSTRAWSEN